MLDIAGSLSAGFAHIRTDFYCIDNRVYFGEFTFYHGSGFEHFKPEALDEELGKLIGASNTRGGVL